MLNLRDKIQNLQNIHILVDNMYEIKFKLRQSGYVHTKDTYYLQDRFLYAHGGVTLSMEPDEQGHIIGSSS